MSGSSRRKFMRQTGTLAGGVLATGLTSVSVTQGREQGSATSPSPLSKTARLRARLAEPGVLKAPEGYTVLAAKLAEAHGFEAIYIGGSMMSATYLGTPDWGLITTSELAEIAGRIAREVSIPAIVDADQAGETALNTYHTVRQYERLGIAAMHIEDSLNPKHADQRVGGGAGPGAPSSAYLQSVERMALRIRAAVDARTDPNFVIIARTDERDLEASITRGRAFANAGADVFMPRAVRPEEIDRVTDEVGLPLLTVGLPMRDVRTTRLKVNVYANLVSGPAAGLCDALFKELKEQDEVANRPRLEADLAGQLTERTTYAQLAEEWTRTP